MDLRLVANRFPKKLANSLIFKKRDGHIIIRSKRPLTPKDFSKLANVVNNLGGRWVSANKDSHFEIFENQLRRIC